MKKANAISTAIATVAAGGGFAGGYETGLRSSEAYDIGYETRNELYHEEGTSEVCVHTATDPDTGQRTFYCGKASLDRMESALREASIPLPDSAQP